MPDHILDLHGYRHHEVDLVVENFLYLNQDQMPLTIICGNSEKNAFAGKDSVRKI